MSLRPQPARAKGPGESSPDQPNENFLSRLLAVGSIRAPVFAGSLNLSHDSCESAFSKHPLVSDLDPAHLEILAACAQNCSFDAGQFLLRQGELANDLYLICSGEVSLEIFVPHQGSVQIEVVRAGEVLGWSWLMPYHRWQLDARAITPVLAVQIDSRSLLEGMERNHDLGYEVLKRLTPVIARRLQAVRSRVYQLCSLAIRDGCRQMGKNSGDWLA